MDYLLNILSGNLWSIFEFAATILISIGGIYFLYSRKAKHYNSIPYIISIPFTLYILVLSVASSRGYYSGYCLLLVILASIPCLYKLKDGRLPENLSLLNILLPAFLGPFLFFLVVYAFEMSPVVIPKKFNALALILGFLAPLFVNIIFFSLIEYLGAPPFTPAPRMIYKSIEIFTKSTSNI
jgi:hypothetical protein